MKVVVLKGDLPAAKGMRPVDGWDGCHREAGVQMNEADGRMTAGSGVSVRQRQELDCGVTVAERGSPPAAGDITGGDLDDCFAATPVLWIAISDLRVTETLRNGGIDEEYVRLLAGVGVPLPPISVHFDTMRVIDGVHRLAAARLNGFTEIEVRYFHGSLTEAFRIGVMANVAHGIPLSLRDRRAAAARMIETNPQRSDRAIAKSAGISAPTVAAIRGRAGIEAGNSRSQNLRFGADGRGVCPVSSVPLMPSDSVRHHPRAVGFRLAAGSSATYPPVSVLPDSGQTPAPTTTERDLLALLAQGLTDDAAAKRLSISVRTERRIVADLMRRLDATSRFEAGVKAARRGWI
jgi:DNA-binding CsgD family transcriptional regulator